MDARGNNTRIKRHLTVALTSILILIGGLFSLNCWGQADRGSISGTVTDSTGAVIPGAQVSVTESATGVGYSGGTTNDHGAYQIVNLPIGKYSLVFKKDGFLVGQ